MSVKNAADIAARLFPYAPEDDLPVSKLLMFHYWGFMRKTPDRTRFQRKANVGRPSHTRHLFERALRDHGHKVAIDLGANVGEFTNAISGIASHVVAVEPDPWTVERLRENINLEKATILEAAVADKEGTAVLRRMADFDSDPQEASAGSSIIANAAELLGGEAIEVKKLSLETVLKEAKSHGPIGIIKMDVEGSEVELLTWLLQQDHWLSQIGAIFIETHERQIPALEKALRSLRFRVWLRGKILRKGPMICMNWP